MRPFVLEWARQLFLGSSTAGNLIKWATWAVVIVLLWAGWRVEQHLIFEILAAVIFVFYLGWTGGRAHLEAPAPKADEPPAGAFWATALALATFFGVFVAALFLGVALGGTEGLAIGAMLVLAALLMVQSVEKASSH